MFIRQQAFIPPHLRRWMQRVMRRWYTRRPGAPSQTANAEGHGQEADMTDEEVLKSMDKEMAAMFDSSSKHPF